MPTFLSDHFTQEEMEASESAEKLGIDNKMDAATVLVATAHLKTLLEPLRAKFGPIRITSGYRSLLLNQAVGGKPTSEHLYGVATDVQPWEGWSAEVTPDVFVAFFVHSGLQFDQVIDELVKHPDGSSSRWVHVASPKPVIAPLPRLEALVFRDGSYSPWPGESLS